MNSLPPDNDNATAVTKPPTAVFAPAATQCQAQQKDDKQNKLSPGVFARNIRLLSHTNKQKLKANTSVTGNSCRGITLHKGSRITPPRTCATQDTAIYGSVISRAIRSFLSLFHRGKVRLNKRVPRLSHPKRASRRHSRTK